MTRTLNIITRIERRTATLGAIRIGERRVQLSAKHLEIHGALKGFELIPKIAQPLQSMIDIEKSGLATHRIISDPTETRESKFAEIG